MKLSDTAEEIESERLAPRDDDEAIAGCVYLQTGDSLRRNERILSQGEASSALLATKWGKFRWRRSSPQKGNFTSNGRANYLLPKNESA